MAKITRMKFGMQSQVLPIKIWQGVDDAAEKKHLLGTFSEASQTVSVFWDEVSDCRHCRLPKVQWDSGRLCDSNPGNSACHGRTSDHSNSTLTMAPQFYKHECIVYLEQQTETPLHYDIIVQPLYPFFPMELWLELLRPIAAVVASTVINEVVVDDGRLRVTFSRPHTPFQVASYLIQFCLWMNATVWAHQMRHLRVLCPLSRMSQAISGHFLTRWNVHPKDTPLG